MSVEQLLNIRIVGAGDVAGSLGEVVGKVSDLRQKQKELTDEQRRWQEEVKKGTPGAADSLKQVNTQLGAVKAEIKATTSEQTRLTNSFNASKSAAGSINAMAAELAKLRNAAKSVAVNSEAFKALQKQIEETDKKLKAANSSLGLNQDNVGNYKESIADAVKEFKLYGVSANDVLNVTKRVRIGFRQAGDDLRGMGKAVAKATVGFVQGGRSIEEATDAIKEIKVASEEATVATEALGVANVAMAEETVASGTAAGAGMEALAVGENAATISAAFLQVALDALGIGLLLAALAGLIAYFRESSEGAAKFRLILAYLKGIIVPLKDALIEMGKTIISFWEGVGNAVAHPIEALEKLKNKAISAAETIGNALLHPIDTIKNIGKAADEATGKVVAMAAEIKRTAAANVAIQEKDNQLRKDRRADIVNDARLEADIAKERELMSESMNDAEKKRHAQRAIELINEREKHQKEFAARELQIFQERFALQKEHSGEELTELEEKKKAVFEIEARWATETRAIQKQLTAIDKRDLKGDKKSAEEEAKERKQHYEEMLALKHDLDKAEIDSTKDKVLKEIAVVNDEYDKEIEKLKKELTEHPALQEEINKVMLAKEEEREQKITDIQTKAEEERLK